MSEEKNEIEEVEIDLPEQEGSDTDSGTTIEAEPKQEAQADRRQLPELRLQRPIVPRPDGHRFPELRRGVPGLTGEPARDRRAEKSYQRRSIM